MIPPVAPTLIAIARRIACAVGERQGNSHDDSADRHESGDQLESDFARI